MIRSKSWGLFMLVLLAMPLSAWGQSTRMAFSSDDGTNPANLEGFIMWEDGSHQTRLTNTGAGDAHEYRPSICPGGRWIVFDRGTFPGNTDNHQEGGAALSYEGDLWVMKNDGSQTTHLLAPSDLGANIKSVADPRNVSTVLRQRPWTFTERPRLVPA